MALHGVPLAGPQSLIAVLEDLITTNENRNPTETTSVGGSCCVHGPSAETIAQTSPDEMIEWLVMAGASVVKARAEAAGSHRDYQGQRYWFCCAACGRLFDADPDQLRQCRVPSAGAGP